MQMDMDGASSKTDTKRYSISKLLYLRHKLPAVNCAVSKINKHPDIAAIFAIPEEALRHPDKYFCKSSALNTQLRRQKPLSIERRQAGGSSSLDSETQVAATKSMSENNKNVQWYLRQRNLSNQATQPYSAPTGLAAQQSENFQRFYRAVVSPTHVRVTAGGRIVPNTKSTAPPETEWKTDRYPFEHQNLLPTIENQVNSESQQWQHFAPLPTPFAGLAPLSPYPQFNFIAQPANAGWATVGAHDQQADRGLEQTFHDGTQFHVTAETPPVVAEPKQRIAATKEITLSPPSQFDHSKPFMYNGQWVYPVPPGFRPPPTSLPVPITMLGNPCFAQPFQPAPAAGFLTSHGSASVRPMNQINQVSAPSTNLASLQMMGSSLHAIPVPGKIPGMVSVSDMTKLHIQSLRNNLKFIDNQLANNRHQIDEHYMETQRQATLAQLEYLEAMLQSQTIQEFGDQTTAVRTVSTMVKSNNNFPNAAYRRAQNNSVSASIHMEADKSRLDVASCQIKLQKTQETDLVTSGVTTERSQDVQVDSKPQISTTKSRLTAAAARAPEFQPRSQALAAAAVQQRKPDDKNHHEACIATNQIVETESEIEARLLSKSSDNWDLGSRSLRSPATSSANLLTPQSMVTPIISLDRLTPKLPRYNTFHEQSAHSPPSIHPPMNPQPIPYLVGVLPHNVHADEVRGTDLVYPRPLTSEELRARHLYWGKAPRSAQSGLPKFDGKDFYPPSPQKGSAQFGSASYLKDAVSHCKSGPVSTESESLFKGPSGLEFSTPSPSGHVSSLQSMATAGALSIFGAQETKRSKDRKENPSEFINSTECSLSNVITMPATSYPNHANSSHPTNFEECSQLFMDRRMADYDSQALIHNGNQAFVDSFVEKQDPMTCRYTSLEKASKLLMSVSPPRHEYISNCSSVDVDLAYQYGQDPTRSSNKSSSGERFAAFGSLDQQNQFLQNLLKNTTQATMAAPALSGTISAATAQGYLPQYRGSAAASLAPAIHHRPSFDVEADVTTPKEKIPTKPGAISSPLVVSSILPENRPLDHDRSSRSTHPLLVSMNAESYMRSLSQKADDQKTNNQSWKDGVPGTGPIIGSNW